ncbi:hypothetical protein QBC39DRAFT_336087, partial [Podospora conica]
MPTTTTEYITSIGRPNGHLFMRFMLGWFFLVGWVLARLPVCVCVLTFAVAPFSRVEPHGKAQQLRRPTHDAHHTLRSSLPATPSSKRRKSGV